MAILDFTKEFDKVPHKSLIHKLNYYGISGSIATWIESFPIGRTQQHHNLPLLPPVYNSEPFLGRYFSFFT